MMNPGDTPVLMEYARIENIRPLRTVQLSPISGLGSSSPSSMPNCFQSFSNPTVGFGT